MTHIMVTHNDKREKNFLMHKTVLVVGDRVIARWTNNKYYPGVVEERPSVGLIKIKFDDGDETTHNANDMSAVLHNRALTAAMVHPGQHVIATWKGGVKYYIGFVTGITENGKFRVLFDDNDEDDYSAKDLRGFPVGASPWEGKLNWLPNFYG